MSAVSTDVKDKRELDVFSKMWNENISNIFVKDFCHPPSRAISYPLVISNPCAIADGILLYGHIAMCGHISPATEKANTAFVDAFVRHPSI
jgi:hypothetical protein